MQDIDLTLDQAHQVFQALAYLVDLEDILFFLNFERHMGSDGVRQPGRFIDAGQRGQNLRWHLFVQFYVLIEQVKYGARQYIGFTLIHVQLVGKY